MFSSFFQQNLSILIKQNLKIRKTKILDFVFATTATVAIKLLHTN